MARPGNILPGSANFKITLPHFDIFQCYAVSLLAKLAQFHTQVFQIHKTLHSQLQQAFI